MPFKIPIAENQVEKKEAAPLAVPNLSAPPPGAFGTGVAEKMGQTGAIVSDFAGKLAQHNLELERDKQRAQSIKLDSDFRTELQQRLFDATPDDKGIPKGIMSRKGDAASGATINFDTTYNEMKKKYLDSAPSEFMKQSIGESITSSYPHLRQSVIEHEGRELRDAQAAKYQQNLDIQVSNASMFSNSPEGLVKELSLGHQHIYENGQSNGVYDKKGLFQPIDKFSRDMVLNAVNPIIGTDPSRAISYLDRINSDPSKPLSPQAYLDIKDHIIEEARKNEARNKAANDTWYEDNFRKAMLDTYDGNMSVNEARRRYRNDELKSSDTRLLEAISGSDDFLWMRNAKSPPDPAKFNEIREAQISGDKTPGEITRMILAAHGKITRDDALYLNRMNSGLPASPVDQEVNANAKTVRDFGSKYFSEHIGDIIPGNIPIVSGIEINKEKKDVQVESAVQSFLKQVDQEKATGPRIGEIRDETIQRFIQQKYPNMTKDKAAHVVITVDGKIKRLLTPDYKLKTKPMFRIIKNNTQEKAPE
jgi:hypothetical protein